MSTYPLVVVTPMLTLLGLIVAPTSASPLCENGLPPKRRYLIFHNLLQHGISVSVPLFRALPLLGEGMGSIF